MTPTVQCLVCGRRMRALGTHISRAHGMSGRAYREQFDLPVTYKLAADDLRAAQSELIQQLAHAGILGRDPLLASDAARHAGRGRRTNADRARQAEWARSIPQKMIPPGGKRADGRDADRAREYQRLYRARKRSERHDP